MTGLRYDGNDWPFPKSAAPQLFPEFSDRDPSAEAWQDDTTLFRHFDSVAEYAKLRASKANSWFHSAHSSFFSGGRDWFGCSGYTEAMSICEKGVWPEGMARMERELESLEVPSPRSIKRHGLWSDQGDALDIHKVYSGQLDQAWRTTVRRPRPASQSLVINFPLYLSSMDHSDRVFWCGAAALKLTDLLTCAGYNVTLIGTQGTEWGGKAGYDTLTVKSASEPLDLNRLMVAVAFPGFTRTVGFHATANLPFEVSRGLGSIVDSTKPIEALGLPASGILSGLYTQVRSRETAIAWMTQQITLIDQTHLEAS